MSCMATGSLPLSHRKTRYCFLNHQIPHSHSPAPTPTDHTPQLCLGSSQIQHQPVPQQAPGGQWPPSTQKPGVRCWPKLSVPGILSPSNEPQGPEPSPSPGPPALRAEVPRGRSELLAPTCPDNSHFLPWVARCVFPPACAQQTVSARPGGETGIHLGGCPWPTREVPGGKGTSKAN